MTAKKTKKRQLICGISLGDDKKPPSELRLFQNGLNETTKGPIFCDVDACAAVLARFRKRGLDKLPFDYGHGMVYGTDHRAAAWFVPEARGGELWAANIEWTPKALEALKDREYRFFSPWCWVGYEDGRILELINVALLCLPATNNQKPIVASAIDPKALGSGNGSRVKQKENKMDPELARLLGILGCKTVDEVEPKVTALGTHAATLTNKVTELETTNKTATEQVTNLTSEVDKAKKETIIVALQNDPAGAKIAPAQLAWARSLSLSALEDFAKTAVPLGIGKAPVTSSPTTPTGEVTVDAQAMLKQFGLLGKQAEFVKMDQQLSAIPGRIFMAPEGEGKVIQPS